MSTNQQMFLKKFRRNILGSVAVLCLFPSGIVSAESVFDGAYVGVQGGINAHNTTLTGPRENNTTEKQEDLGNLGGGAGLFAGYGKTFGRFYLGGEIDAAGYGGSTESNLNPAGRQMEISKKADASATLRAGYLISPNTLIYGRGGLAVGRFETDLKVLDGSTFNSDDDLLGMRFGVGVETMPTDNLMLRLDATYTAYEDSSIGFSDAGFSGTDRFSDNDELMVRIGLGYRFGNFGETEDAPSYGNPLLPGFYVGLQSELNALNAHQTGPRSGIDRDDDAFGDMGLGGGAFVGIGTRFDRWYLGTEISGGFSNAMIESSVQPNGRITEVAKKFDIGASLRGGYYILPSTLLYARAGLAVSQFNTFLRMGDGRTFDQDDTLMGLRFGTGVDIAMRENLFLRLDYSYSMYDSYSLDRSSSGQISSGNRKIEDFDLDESLFRIGIAYRFGGSSSDDAEPIGKMALPDGVKLAGFEIHPELSITATLDDNIFASPSSAESDKIVTISPSIEIDSKWKKHQLGFYGAADIVRYADHTTEDYESYVGGFDGRFDIDAKTNVFGGASFESDVESRDSVDEVNGAEPTDYTVIEAYAGGLKRFDKVGVRLGGTYAGYNFDDTPAGLGTINNDDRDRDMYTGGLWVGYEIDRNWEVFGQAAADIRRYRDDQDDGGFDRDSDGGRFLAGVSYKIGRSFDAELYTGYILQDYSDDNLPDVKTFALGGNLSWAASYATTFNAYLDRSVAETTLSNASSSLDTSLGGNVEHKLTENLSVSPGFSVTNVNYEGVDRVDNIASFGLGVDYDLTKNFSLGLDYSFAVRESDVALENYERNRVGVRLTGKF